MRGYIVFDRELIDDVLNVDLKFREEFGINFIRPEAKIMLLLKQRGPLSIKEAMSFINVSYRGFYLIINKMIEKRYVHIKQDDSDGRVKRIFLDDILKSIL